MSLIVKDRVMEFTITTGTGALALSGAITGFRRFSAVCSTNDTCYYFIEAVDANGIPSGDWEAGLGTYSGTNTLTRTTVHASSNAGSAVNFSAGVKRVSIAQTAAVSTGKLINKQIITATGSGTYTPTAGTTFVIVELQGAGGGGGGCQSAGGTNVAIAGGGGCGGWGSKRLTADFSGASYSVGAKGAGGAAGNNAGAAGGNTTFTTTAPSSTTYTAAGGSGGSQLGPAAPSLPAGGVAGGALTGSFDETLPGAASVCGVATASSRGQTSAGGAGKYSPGGASAFWDGANMSVAGTNATGKGGGGSGAMTGASGAAKAGGDGSDGQIVIWEYS